MNNTKNANLYSNPKEFDIKKLERSAITGNTDTDYKSEDELDPVPCHNFGFTIEQKKEIVPENFATYQRAKDFQVTLIEHDLDQEFIEDFVKSPQPNYFAKIYNKFKEKITNIVTKIKEKIEFLGNLVSVTLSANPKKKLQDLHKQSEQLREEINLYKEVSSFHAQSFLKEINTTVVPYSSYEKDLDAIKKQEQHDIESYIHIEIAGHCNTEYTSLSNKIDALEKQILVLKKETPKYE